MKCGFNGLIGSADLYAGYCSQSGSSEMPDGRIARRGCVEVISPCRMLLNRTRLWSDRALKARRCVYYFLILLLFSDIGTIHTKPPDI